MGKQARRQASSAPLSPLDRSQMQWIERGTFRMGCEAFYPDEAPVHSVAVDGFWMDARAVTNAEFAAFVEATGYVTLAERAPSADDYPEAPPEALVAGSLVFCQPTKPVSLHDWTQWWAYLPGADWRHPEGAASSIADRASLPVVHVAYEDAAAYAAWVGKRLPTEAEWEYAARGGLDGADYPWGDELRPDGKRMANTWEGEFPWQNLREDGLARVLPVGSFPPNGYGLYDVAGNVWEWTSDWYRPRHEVSEGCCQPRVNPRGGRRDESFDPGAPGARIPRRVIKGGSYLCSPNYCFRFRPAARSGQAIESSTCHLGLRCAWSPRPSGT